jgi:hypothetical protein
MPGKGLTENGLKEVLQEMVLENKLGFIGNKYFLQ